VRKKGKRSIFLVFFLGFMLVTVSSLYAADYKYVASKFSIKYHLLSCKQVRGLQEQNTIGFTKAEEAVKAGYVPCGVCKPLRTENDRKN
jgi:methylphosphotriester-DNA--protein-cysteine methyltransferase